MKNNEFATFNPIMEDINVTPQSVSQYYANNGLTPDNIYMHNYINEKPAAPIENYKGTSFNVQDFLNEYYPATEHSVTETPSAQPNSPIQTQQPKNKKDFLRMYEKSAEDASKRTGMSKDLLLAQVALETGWGAHTPGYNVGGLKADSSWQGKSQVLRTKEQGANGLYSTSAKFRAYDTPEQGFAGYVDFLSKNKRYKALVGVADPYKAAEVMSKTGYATDKNYKQKLQEIIQQIQQSRS